MALLENWVESNRIKVNATKCAHVIFTLRKTTQSADLELNNGSTQQVATVKYLGLHLDSKLTWKQHIQQKTNQNVESKYVLVIVKYNNLCKIN